MSKPKSISKPTPSPAARRFDGRISVVLPSFNDDHFLERALCSVLDQRDPDLEIHVVDGGSHDTTLDLLAAYDADLASWTTAWDSGPAEAINHGLTRCNGDLILILAADDLLLPGSLHALRQTAAQQPNAAWFVGDTQALDEQDQPLPDHPLTRQHATAQRPLDHPAHALLDPAGPPALSACAFRRSALDLLVRLDAQRRHTYGHDLVLRLLDQQEIPARVPAPFAGLRDAAATLLPPASAASRFDLTEHGTNADVLDRQRETLDLFEHFADRLPPAHRFAVAQQNADRRHLLDIAQEQLQTQNAAAPLWRQALKNPWLLTDPAYRRHLLAGHPNTALEQRPAA